MIFGLDMFASVVFANGDTGDRDLGKHWTKQCPAVSEWAKIDPEIYPSEICSATPNFNVTSDEDVIATMKRTL